MVMLLYLIENSIVVTSLGYNEVFQQFYGLREVTRILLILKITIALPWNDPRIRKSMTNNVRSENNNIKLLGIIFLNILLASDTEKIMKVASYLSANYGKDSMHQMMTSK